MYFQQLPGPNGGESSDYDPLFPFGHGLPYTTYEIRDVAVADSTVRRRGTATVANTGDIAGDGKRRVLRGDYRVVAGEQAADITVR